MNINFSTNPIQNPNISTVQNADKSSVFGKITSKLEDIKTDISLSKELYNESLTRKYNPEGLFKGYTTMEGDVNGKFVNLKKDTVKTSLFSGYNTYKGIIGDETADITIEGKTITGKIGDKEINITFDKGLGIFKPYSVTGKIGDKEINITKGSALDEAQGENDILTTLASLSGNKFTIKDGKFGGLALSKQASQDEAEAAMMQQQQMMNQQMMDQQMMNQQIMNQQMMMNTPGFGFM